MMRKEILEQVQAEYAQRRAENAREEQRRRSEAQARCPELRQTLEARQELIYGSVRGILRGEKSYDDLPARMDVMNRRVASLLTQNGYPTDYLDPVYRCPKCKDTGYVGEPVREMCACMRAAYYARLYRAVGLGESAEQSFERFDASVFPDKPIPGMGCTQRQMMLVTRDMCRDWAEKFPNVQTRDLVLSGKSGLGKTYLLHAMAKVLLDRGFNVLLMSAYRFLDTARRAYFGGPQDGMDSLMNADVLMLDDLGAEPLMENITVVQLFNLINERQNAGRATVVSTNLNEKELRERYTERVASRLLDTRKSAFIPFQGDDVRRA